MKKFKGVVVIVFIEGVLYDSKRSFVILYRDGIGLYGYFVIKIG